MLDFINALPGAVSQGLIWGIMAIGVYITYKLLDKSQLITPSPGFLQRNLGGGVLPLLHRGMEWKDTVSDQNKRSCKTNCSEHRK